MKAIQTRLHRLEARSPTKLENLTDADLDAVIARLRATDADDKELPVVVAACLGWNEPRASLFIADCLASS